MPGEDIQNTTPTPDATHSIYRNQYYTQTNVPLSKEYSRFFKDLSANNSTAWFNANKQRYEQHVKAPFHELAGEVLSLMKKPDAANSMEPKDAVKAAEGLDDFMRKTLGK
jgi:hypothetical protein